MKMGKIVLKEIKTVIKDCEEEKEKEQKGE